MIFIQQKKAPPKFLPTPTEKATVIAHKRVNRITIVAILFAITLFMIIPSVERAHAWGETDVSGLVNSFCTIICEMGTYPLELTINGPKEGIGGGDGFHMLYQSATATEMFNQGDKSVSKDGIDFNIYAPYATLIDTLKVVGALMLIALAMAKIFSSIEKGMEGTQAVYSCLMEIGIAGLFIMYSDKIIGLLGQIGLSFVTQVFGENGFTNETAEQFKVAICGACDIDVNNLQNVFFLKVVPFILLTILPFAAAFLMFIATCFIIIQVVLEIAIRRILAPIAIVDIYQEGLRSPGVRYIKKYFACFLKLLICGIALAIYPKFVTAVASSLNTGEFDIVAILIFVFSIVAGGFAVIGFMLKGGEVANDVVGA